MSPAAVNVCPATHGNWSPFVTGVMILKMCFVCRSLIFKTVKMEDLEKPLSCVAYGLERVL